MINLIAKPTLNGQTFTLTTLALKYLLEAESLYGARTGAYEYMGLELNEYGPPKVWYPFSKYVIIQVSSSTASDIRQGIFQIAHEVVHVLSPNGLPTTNNLEEGLATYFSKVVTDRDSGDIYYALNSLNESKYLYPYELVASLLSIRPDAILELRKFQPVIGKITKQDFIAASIDISEDLIEGLLKPMVY